MEETMQGGGGDSGGAEEPVRVVAGQVTLEGDLGVPDDPVGVVLFAHGSGSSRHSSRNRAVARALRDAGLATLLIDLLTEGEEASERHTGHLRFDIGFLAGRLVAAMAWLAEDDRTRGLPVGLFGASTGGGAALVSAAERPDAVGAVVSRGGRPDLAGDALRAVRAPTLLLVGGADVPVIGMNEWARDRLVAATVELAILPGATHLFPEPGALERVAELARDWFLRWLPRGARMGETRPNRTSTGAQE